MHRFVVILLGMNDIGHADGTEMDQVAVFQRLTTHFQQLIARLHTFNIVVFGGTLTPFICPEGVVGNIYAQEPIRERTRLALNDWIRTSDAFDAVVDFDKMVRDPYNETLLINDFDSGDCLHPNDAGNEIMAQQFPLELFTQFKNDLNTIQ